MGSEIRNTALQGLQRLVGSWDTAGSHPYLQGAMLRGRTSFDWLEGGAFLIMRSEVDHPSIPTGIAIFGSDDASGEYFMLYFDERGVSRKYDVTVDETAVTWSRHTPEFSQRFTLVFGVDDRTMVGNGKMSMDSGPWEDDLQLTYTRA